MQEKSYFVTFIYFDTKHQRSNKMSHLSIALLEGEKHPDSHISNMRLLSSYGFYSHRIPDITKKSLWEKFLSFIGVTFRIQGSYAEFKKEDLINIDLGFGIEGGPIIEISAEEKATLEASIQASLENEAQFFAEADLKAKSEVENLPLADQTMKEEKFKELKNHYREKHYQTELDKLKTIHNDENLDTEFLFENTAHASGLMSSKRFQQEKLKARKNIPLFEFGLSPQDSTCKSMGIDFVINCLAPDGPGKIRKIILSELKMKGFYTHAIPRFTPAKSKIIFNSEQSKYSSTCGKLPFPKRIWEDEGLCCSLVFFEENKYIDLTGKCQELQKISDPKRYIYLVENLLHLKRLLNDFCFAGNDYQQHIRLCDQAIAKMMRANNVDQIINVYHDTIKELQKTGCFNSISKNIFKTEHAIDGIKNLSSYIKKQDIKMEDGLLAEIKRLPKIKNHASLYSLYQEMPRPPKRHFSFFSREVSNKKPDEIEMVVSVIPTASKQAVRD